MIESAGKRGGAAGAEARFAFRFGAARRTAACAVAAIDFADQCQPLIDSISGRCAVKHHIILGEKINGRGEDAKAEIAVELPGAEVFAGERRGKEVGLI